MLGYADSSNKSEAYHPLTKFVMLHALDLLLNFSGEFSADQIRQRSKMTWNSHATSQVAYVEGAYNSIRVALENGKPVPTEIPTN